MIPLIAALTAILCGMLARSGMRWFRTLRLPAWSLAGLVITWAVLLMLADVSALLAWSATTPSEHPRLAAVYLINAFLNAAWCYLFFVRHQIGSATLDAALLAIAIAVLVLEVLPASIAAAFLVAPSFVWALFAMYLTLTVFRMNVRGGSSDL